MCWPECLLDLHASRVEQVVSFELEKEEPPADVFLRDGTHVNHELVKDGWCWWYRKYAPWDTELEKLEKDAREAKEGLWADPAPIPPWVYRKMRRA